MSAGDIDSARGAGSGLRWLWLSAVILVLDQLTKWLAVSTLRPYESVRIAPLLNLTLTFNPGAAFKCSAQTIPSILAARFITKLNLCPR